jgi:hypothetical protein
VDGDRPAGRASTAWAGAQIEEPLIDSVRSALSGAVGQAAPPGWCSPIEAQRQLSALAR